MELLSLASYLQVAIVLTHLSVALEVIDVDAWITNLYNFMQICQRLVLIHLCHSEFLNQKLFYFF